MKTKILLLILLSILASGQDNVRSGGNYYFNHIPAEDLSDLSSSSSKFRATKSDLVEILDGNTYNMQVTKIDNGRVFFVFGTFKESASLERKINYLEFSTKNFSVNDSLSLTKVHNKNLRKTIVYSLLLNNFEKNTKPLYNRVEYRIGAYTVPFKLRLKNFSFDSNINIGANIGAKIRWDRRIENGFSFEPIMGFGLSSIKLDDSNSNALTTTNVSAFTVNLGLLFHLTNSINFGMTFGFDNISKKDRINYQWIHNGKGWLGLGINVSLSNQSDNTGDSGSNKSK